VSLSLAAGLHFTEARSPDSRRSPSATLSPHHPGSPPLSSL
jgi:hypothetical protein